MARAAACLSLTLIAQAGRTTAVLSLNRVESVRSRALGGATAALGADPGLVWLNPASSAEASRAGIALAGQNGYFGDLVGHAIGAIPVGFGVVSLGLATYYSGPVSLNASDGTSREVVGNQDVMGYAGLGMPLSADVDAGVGVKAVRSQLFQAASARAVALDAGVQVRLNQTVKVGLAVRNAGTELRYSPDAAGEAMPMSVHAGAALGWRLGGGILIALADSAYSPGDRTVSLQAGAEYQMNRVLAFRIGTRQNTGEESGRFTAGMGISIARAGLDIGTELGNSQFNSPWSIGFRIPF